MGLAFSKSDRQKWKYDGREDNWELCCEVDKDLVKTITSDNPEGRRWVLWICSMGQWGFKAVFHLPDVTVRRRIWNSVSKRTLGMILTCEVAWSHIFFPKTKIKIWQNSITILDSKETVNTEHWKRQLAPNFGQTVSRLKITLSCCQAVYGLPSPSQI